MAADGAPGVVVDRAVPLSLQQGQQIPGGGVVGGEGQVPGWAVVPDMAEMDLNFLQLGKVLPQHLGKGTGPIGRHQEGGQDGQNPHKDQEVSSSRHGALLSPGIGPRGGCCSLSAWSEGANPWLRAPSPAGGREEDRPAFRLSQSFSRMGLPWARWARAAATVSTAWAGERICCSPVAMSLIFTTPWAISSSPRKAT